MIDAFWEAIMPSDFFRMAMGLLYTSLILVTNCSYFFDEKLENTEIQYEKNIGGCFQTSEGTIFRYFSPSPGASVSEQEIDELTDCYKEAFESLVTYTNSGHSDPETYSAESIKLLLDKLNNGVSLRANRIRGYIVLKSFLIGGDSERVSKREFLILQDLLLKFKNFLKNLLPYRDVIIRTGVFFWENHWPKKNGGL